MSEEARLAAILEVRLNRIDEKLSEFNRKIANSMKKSQKDMDAANDNWAKLFNKKPNLAKALDGVIDNTRLKVLDSGVARVGLFGSALEELGPIGLAAAAGVGAFALAATKAREAAAFGDEIGDTAGRLHVTTDALQEFRYANRLAGGEIEGADAALESFGATLGKAQAGLPKAQKAFKELGFTKAQIDSFKTVEEGLDAVTDRIGKLKSDPQKDAVVDQLGLTGMKTLVEGGLESMRQLKFEAQSLGLVMDSELIAKAGVANDKFESLERIIDVQLKSAFVDLAPVMLSLLKIAADIAKEFADAVADMQRIDNRTTSQLERQRDAIVARMNTAEGKGYPYLTDNSKKPYMFGGREKATLEERLANVNAELARRALGAPGEPGVPSGTSLKDLEAQKSAQEAALAALQQRKQTDQAIASAKERELAAMTGSGRSLEESLQLEDDIKDLRRTERDQALADQVAQYKLSAGKQGLSAAQGREIAAANKKADAAEDATRATEKAALLAAQALSIAQDHTASAANEASIRAGLARTVAERLKIESADLARRQAGERDRLENSIRFDAKYRDANGADEQARSDLARRQAAERDQLTKANLGPLADWLDKAPNSIAELNEAFQSLEVQGLDSLNQGLAEAAVNSKNLGATAANVFKQMAVQLIETLLQSGEAKAASFLGLPGFSGGGFTGHGGVNEVAGLAHRGEVVFEQPAVARIGLPVLEALRKGKIPGFSKGGLVGFGALAMPSVQSLGGRTAVVQQFFPSFKGAVVTEDLMASFKSYADDVGQHAARLGAQGGAALVQSQMQQAATLRLGK